MKRLKEGRVGAQKTDMDEFLESMAPSGAKQKDFAISLTREDLSEALNSPELRGAMQTLKQTLETGKCQSYEPVTPSFHPTVTTMMQEKVCELKQFEKDKRVEFKSQAADKAAPYSPTLFKSSRSITQSQTVPQVNTVESSSDKTRTISAPARVETDKAENKKAF